MIHINTGVKHSSSKSPEHNKLDKPKQTPKGVNIIPLKKYVSIYPNIIGATKSNVLLNNTNNNNNNNKGKYLFLT